MPPPPTTPVQIIANGSGSTPAAPVQIAANGILGHAVKLAQFRGDDFILLRQLLQNVLTALLGQFKLRHDCFAFS